MNNAFHISRVRVGVELRGRKEGRPAAIPAIPTCDGRVWHTSLASTQPPHSAPSISLPRLSSNLPAHSTTRAPQCCHFVLDFDLPLVYRVVMYHLRLTSASSLCFASFPPDVSGAAPGVASVASASLTGQSSNEDWIVEEVPYRSCLHPFRNLLCILHVFPSSHLPLTSKSSSISIPRFPQLAVMGQHSQDPQHAPRLVRDNRPPRSGRSPWGHPADRIPCSSARSFHGRGSALVRSMVLAGTEYQD